VTVKGYKPHDNQRIIHDSINNDGAKYYVLNIGRQFGKTMLCNNQQLYWCINDPGSFIGWVSPIYKQSKKVYKELKKATVRSGLFAYNDTDLIVEGFGSTIQFFSGERADGIRGNTFDYLICDEFDFMKKDIWQEVLQPTILVRGKKVVFISTPKGKGAMYQLSLQQNYDKRYKYFHFTSYDNPMIDRNEIDSIKRSLPEHIFRQEYLAEFIDNAGGLFTSVKDNVIESGTPDGKNYGGLDIGRADDYTVITIMNKRGHMVCVERYRQDDWTNIIDKVASVIRRYNALTYVEVNNQGDVFYEMLKKKVGNLIEPFTTTMKSKPIMIEDLALSFEQSSVKVLNEQWLLDELDAFTYVYDNKTRRVKYGAPEGIHDDGVISLSLCLQSIKHLSRKGVYTILR
jgi:hypothetical protein